jgi:ribonucleoside-diphosphate reductase alpha chain
MDYMFRWMALKFLPDVADEVNTAHRTDNGLPARGQVMAATDAATAMPLVGRRPPGNSNAAALLNELVRQEQQVFRAQADAPPCSECGAIMVRNGACYKCLNCGITSGCS